MRETIQKNKNKFIVERQVIENRLSFLFLTKVRITDSEMRLAVLVLYECS